MNNIVKNFTYTFLYITVSLQTSCYNFFNLENRNVSNSKINTKNYSLCYVLSPLRVLLELCLHGRLWNALFKFSFEILEFKVARLEAFRQRKRTGLSLLGKPGLQRFLRRNEENTLFGFLRVAHLQFFHQKVYRSFLMLPSDL